MKIRRPLGAALIAALALAAFGARAAGNGVPGDALSEADQQCLSCHGTEGLSTKLGDGAELGLHVPAAAFAKSVHAAVGCAACHADVDVKKHPGDAKPIASAAALAAAFTQSCRSCHEASFDAHAASIHGRAQGKEALAAPSCTTCHGTHDIVRASTGTPLREACLGCHADAPATHDKWLPNTKLHLQVVACAVCHAPAAGRRVDLRFYDVAAKRELVTDGRPMVGKGANGATAPLDESSLRDLVRAVDRGGGAGKVVLMGRVVPNAAAEGHRLLAKGEALKDCAGCHRKGADPFQKVSLSVVTPDGERILYDTRKEVLQSPTSVESVRGFYAMGGTRIGLLDAVLALALVGGISAPLGHFVVRRLMRRKEERHE